MFRSRSPVNQIPLRSRSDNISLVGVIVPHPPPVYNEIRNGYARPQSGILSGFAHMLCSTHPSKSRLSLGRQHIACYVVWAALLSAVALRTLYFTHFKLFYFQNVIGLVQRIVRFVCVPNRKPRTERFNTNTRIVTPLIYIYVCVCIYNPKSGRSWDSMENANKKRK